MTFQQFPSKILRILRNQKKGVPAILLERIKGNFKTTEDQKLRQITGEANVFEVHKKKPMNNLLYLAGLIVVLSIAVRALMGSGKKGDRRPASVGHPLVSKSGVVEFRVCYRDYATHSLIFLGKIIERRRRKRGNNFEGLLIKARKEYSCCVKDPSTILLLDSEEPYRDRRHPLLHSRMKKS